MFYTSRTAALTYQDCPRKRFLSFHFGGHGISPSKLNLDIFIGTIVHRGLQNLLDHTIREHDGDARRLKADCINESIEVAKVRFFSDLKDSAGFFIKEDNHTDYEYIVTEAWALCEALIRAYAIWRLPSFGEQFEVLEVEKEEEYSLANGIIFQAKADGLLRSRYNNKLHVLSFKTAKDFYDVTIRNILHDMQGVSEMAAINERLARYARIARNNFHIERLGDILIVEAEDFFAEEFLNNERVTPKLMEFCYLSTQQNLKCHAVQYEYLLKGAYKQDPYNSGLYKWQTHFLHPIKNNGVQNIFSKQVRGLDYKWKPGKGRRSVDWEKIDIWEDMGVEKWLELLMTGAIQPEEGDAFQQFFRAETIIRSEEEIEEWKISTSHQEQQVQLYNELIELTLKNNDEQAVEELLMLHFRKHTNRCHDYYGHDCPFVKICHENHSPEELIELGIMQVRKPHHATELKEFEKKGYLK